MSHPEMTESEMRAALARANDLPREITRLGGADHQPLWGVCLTDRDGNVRRIITGGSKTQVSQLLADERNRRAADLLARFSETTLGPAPSAPASSSNQAPAQPTDFGSLYSAGGFARRDDVAKPPRMIFAPRHQPPTPFRDSVHSLPTTPSHIETPRLPVMDSQPAECFGIRSGERYTSPDFTLFPPRSPFTPDGHAPLQAFEISILAALGLSGHQRQRVYEALSEYSGARDSAKRRGAPVTSYDEQIMKLLFRAAARAFVDPRGVLLFVRDTYSQIPQDVAAQIERAYLAEFTQDRDPTFSPGFLREYDQQRRQNVGRGETEQGAQINR